MRYSTPNQVMRKRKSRIPKIITCFLVLFIVLDAGYRFLLPVQKAEGLSFLREEYTQVYEPYSYGSLRSNMDLTMQTGTNPQTIRIQTNSFGMRMEEISLAKNPEMIRIAIMGDSAAFGWMLPQKKAFPALLQNILKQEKEGRYEVLNFSAPGYTSFQGIKQYEQIVHNFKPDILILSFGLYDSFETRIPDSQLYSVLEQYRLTEKITGFPKLWHDYSTIGHWLIAKQRRDGVLALRKYMQDRVSNDEWFKRVDVDEFKNNIRAIVQHHTSQGRKVILLHTNLLNFYVAFTLRSISQELGLPLIDIRTVVDQLGGIEERKNAMKLELESQGTIRDEDSQKYHFLFRLYVPASISVYKNMYIVGNPKQLGNNRPNQVKLYDDGTHGDERRGDRVWSLEITLDQAAPMIYSFTNSGEPGQWPETAVGFENKAKNSLLFHRVDPTPFPKGTHWTSLLYTYGKVPFEHLVIPNSDLLPNEMGQTLIAKRLAAIILND